MNGYQSEKEVVSNKVLALFKSLKSHKFIFVEPGGNPGDYLIYKGAEKLAKISGIKYTTVNYDKFLTSQYPKDYVIYIHGSGGYVPFWEITPLVLKKAITSHLGIVIMGPTTFFNDTAYLKETIAIDAKDRKADKLIIFAREQTSFISLKDALSENIELNLDHDTALNLNMNDIIKIFPKKSFRLYAIREDKESTNIPFHSYYNVWIDPASPELVLNLKQWIYLHARAKAIVTNRCHSAILGSILNIPVTLLPNSYHKNRSIWEYSLCHKDVRWSDSLSLDRVDIMINSFKFLKKVASSYLYQSALKFYYGTYYRRLHNPIICEKILLQG